MPKTEISIEDIPVEAEMAVFNGRPFVGFRPKNTGKFFTPGEFEELFCEGKHPVVQSALQAQKTGPSQTGEQCALYEICHGFYLHNRFSPRVDVGVVMAHVPEGVDENKVHQKGNCQLIFPPAS